MCVFLVRTKDQFNRQWMTFPQPFGCSACPASNNTQLFTVPPLTSAVTTFEGLRGGGFCIRKAPTKEWE